MIELGSLVGFAVVFYCSAVGLSALVGAVAVALQPRVARHGARTEKHVAGFAIAAPVIVAFGATLALALYSLAGTDHCLEHSHHLHLCLRHGGGFASRALLLAGLAGFVVYGLSAAVTRVARLSRAGRLTRKLARSATEVPLAGVDVLVTPSEKPFCFSAGLLGSRVFMSSAAWKALDDDERRAVIAHEAAHGRSRDLLARTTPAGSLARRSSRRDSLLGGAMRPSARVTPPPWRRRAMRPRSRAPSSPCCALVPTRPSASRASGPATRWYVWSSCSRERRPIALLAVCSSRSSRRRFSSSSLLP